MNDTQAEAYENAIQHEGSAYLQILSFFKRRANLPASPHAVTTGVSIKFLTVRPSLTNMKIMDLVYDTGLREEIPGSKLHCYRLALTTFGIVCADEHRIPRSAIAYLKAYKEHLT